MKKDLRIKFVLIFLTIGVGLNITPISQKSSGSPVLSQNQQLQAGKIRRTEILRARIGVGPDEIDVSKPDEGSPEGPMSFALGKNEEIYILDQINSRIQ